MTQQKNNKTIIKVNYTDTIPPLEKSADDAGFDLRLNSENSELLLRFEAKRLRTGIRLEMPSNVAALVLPRSSQAERGLTIVNSPGLIDPSYRGEILIAVKNNGAAPLLLMPGERIAQLLFVPLLDVNLEAVDVLSDTERGDGGFGSTGTT